MRCPCCHDKADASGVVGQCARCSAVVHVACFGEHGGLCPACGSSPIATAIDMAPEQSRRARGWVRALLLLALLQALTQCLSGCAALPESPPSGPPLSQRALIVWVDGAPGRRERAELLERLDRCEALERAAFGRGAPALAVEAVIYHGGRELPRELSPGPLRPGQRLVGLSGGGAIHVLRRRSGPAAIIHELHHLRLGSDRRHASPTWREVARLERAEWLGW